MIVTPVLIVSGLARHAVRVLVSKIIQKLTGHHQHKSDIPMGKVSALSQKLAFMWHSHFHGLCLIDSSGKHGAVMYE